MGDMVNLRGLVLSQYKSIGAFADAINWSRGKASRIINEIQEPTVDDMIAIAELLGISSPADFMAIFFKNLSTKWTGGVWRKETL